MDRSNIVSIGGAHDRLEIAVSAQGNRFATRLNSFRAMVVALLGGQPLSVALRRGSAAGALAVGRRGVYDALPTAAEIDEFLAPIKSFPAEQRPS